MIVCEVRGSVVATAKVPRLVGQRLLICQPVRLEPGADATPAGPSFLAVDAVGAGEGHLVAVVQGQPAMAVLPEPQAAIDAAVVAIVDRVEFRPAR
jgi:ethanolamine utilization protein EutN